MITVKNMKTLLKLPSKPKEGDLACITDENNKVYCYTKDKWNPADAQGEITTNLYDLNATAIAQLPAHNKDPIQIKEDIQLINNFVEEYDGNYFILLCRELPNKTFYSTIYCRNSSSLETTGQAVISCLEEIGTLHAISEEENHLEFWVKDSKENMICLLFFNCDSMIIGVK